MEIYYLSIYFDIIFFEFCIKNDIIFFEFCIKNDMYIKDGKSFLK